MSTDLVVKQFDTQALHYVKPGNIADHYIREHPRVCPESSYFIHGGFELLEMTGDVSAFANRMGFSMDEYLDDLDGNDLSTQGIHPGYTLATMWGVREHFKCWYNHHATDMQRAYVGMGLIGGLSYQFQEFHWNLNDQTVQAQLDAGGVGRDGITIEHLAAQIDQDRRLSLWVDMVKESYHNAVQAIAVVGVKDLNAYGEELENRARALFEQHHQLGMSDEERLMRYSNKNMDKVDIKQRTRSALKKGLGMLSSLIGEAPVRAFVSGDGFNLEGDLFNYRVSKTVSIIGHTQYTGNGHTPYCLGIYSKDTGNHLGDACVYFKETPVIDQLIALTFFIKNKEEESLLKTANIFARSEEFYTDTMMALVKPECVNRDRFQMVQFGLNQTDQLDQHRVEIVPWRIRTQENAMKLLSQRTNVPFVYLRSLVNQMNQPVTTRDDFNIVDSQPWLDMLS